MMIGHLGWEEIDLLRLLTFGGSALKGKSE